MLPTATLWVSCLLCTISVLDLCSGLYSGSWNDPSVRRELPKQGAAFMAPTLLPPAGSHSMIGFNFEHVSRFKQSLGPDVPPRRVSRTIVGGGVRGLGMSALARMFLLSEVQIGVTITRIGASVIKCPYLSQAFSLPGLHQQQLPGSVLANSEAGEFRVSHPPKTSSSLESYVAVVWSPCGACCDSHA